jgi:hypothetical protein
MKAYVANPRNRKASEKKKKKSSRANPLPLAIFNPEKRRAKSMAKKKKKASGGGHSRNARRSYRNPFHHHHRRRSRRNPLPDNFGHALVAVISGAASIVGVTYLPNLIPLVSENTLLNYLAAIGIAVLPPFFLGAKHPNFARGWLYAGGAGIALKAVDDLTGQSYVVISAGQPASATPAPAAPGLSSFFANGRGPLPGPNVFAVFSTRRGLPAPASTTPASASVGQNAPAQGMGWVRY